MFRQVVVHQLLAKYENTVYTRQGDVHECTCISPILGLGSLMRVIALSTLKAFWEQNSRYRDAAVPTITWYRLTVNAN